MLLHSSIFGSMYGDALKYLIVFSLVVLSSKSLCAQDLIVTIFNDSIHCRVESTTDTFIYYRTKKTKRNNQEIISRKEVVELIYNFEQENIPPSKLREYLPFHVYGTVTGSRLLSEIPRDLPNEFSDYLNELKWGIGYSVGANYMLNEAIGVGAIFTQTEYNNSIDVMQVGTNVTGKLSDEIRLSYLGLCFVYSSAALSKSQTFFQLNLGFGYQWYVNEAQTIYPFRVNGNSFGGHLMGGANLSLGSGIYVPLQLGLKGVSVQNVDVNFPEELPDQFREGISIDVMNNDPVMLMRIELSVGLLITF